MGLFSRNYDKPGPGVNKDEPRKKGAARFFELLLRDFWDLTKLNLLFCICVLPTAVLFVLGTLGAVEYYSGLALMISLMLAFPVGGALTACVYYITKMMRDDPSYVWYEFKRKFKENYKQAALPGILCTAFVYAQILLWTNILLGEPTSGVSVWLVVAILSLLVFGIITPYIFLSFAYIEQRTLIILKNSVLMSFGFLPRSIIGALLGGIIWIAFMLFLPISLLFLPLVILFFVSISMLLNLMWVWKPFDEHFKIEETLIERQNEEEN